MHLTPDLGINVDAVHVVRLEVQQHEELEDAWLVVEEVGERHSEVPPVGDVGRIPVPFPSLVVAIVQGGGRLQGGEVVAAVPGALDHLLGAEELPQVGVRPSLVDLAGTLQAGGQVQQDLVPRAAAVWSGGTEAGRGEEEGGGREPDPDAAEEEEEEEKEEGGGDDFGATAAAEEVVVVGLPVLLVADRRMRMRGRGRGTGGVEVVRRGVHAPGARGKRRKDLGADSGAVDTV